MKQEKPTQNVDGEQIQCAIETIPKQMENRLSFFIASNYRRANGCASAQPKNDKNDVSTPATIGSFSGIFEKWTHQFLNNQIERSVLHLIGQFLFS